MSIIGSAISGVINSIKTIGEAVWNEFKTLGQFIANAIMKAIIDALIFTMVSILHALSYMSEHAIPNGPIIERNSDGVTIGTNYIRLFRIDDQLVIQTNDWEFSIASFGYSSQWDFETLTINSEETMWIGTIGKLLTLTGIAMGAGGAGFSIAFAMAGISAQFIASSIEKTTLTDTSIPVSDREVYQDEIRNYHLGGVFGHLASIVIEVSGERVIPSNWQGNWRGAIAKMLALGFTGWAISEGFAVFVTNVSFLAEIGMDLIFIILPLFQVIFKFMFYEGIKGRL